jgi:hypothetical protein
LEQNVSAAKRIEMLESSPRKGTVPERVTGTELAKDGIIQESDLKERRE